MEKIKIEVNSNVELINIILYLSNYNIITESILGFNPIIDYQTNYTKDIKSFFHPYLDHEIFRAIEAVTKNGFFLSRPLELALSTEHHTSSNRMSILSNQCLEYGGGVENINKLIKLINDFKSISNFKQFEQNIKNHYNSLIPNLENAVNKFPFIQQTISFYGKDINSYRFIISSLLNGSFGIYFKSTTGNPDIYSIFDVDLENKCFRGACSESDTLVCATIFHELSHPIINPITELYLDLLNANTSKYEVIKKYKSDISGYSNWEECVNEHIIRAFSVIMVRKYIGLNNSLDFLQEHALRGYIYLPEIVEKLEYYDRNRDVYHNIDTFYPELLSVFL